MSISMYEDIAMAHGWLDPARKRQIESQRREAKEDAKREAAEKHKRVHTLALVELTISKAEFVAPSDDNGLSDPYVKYGAGDDCSFNFLSSRRTPVVVLHPVWNHKDTIVLREDESRTHSAHVLLRLMRLQKYWEKTGSTQLQMTKPGNHKLIFGIVHISWVDKGVQK